MTAAIIREFSGVTSSNIRAVVISLIGLATIAVIGVAQPLPLPVMGLGLLTFVVLSFISPLGIVMATVVTLPYFYRPLELGDQQFAASEVLLASVSAGLALRIVYDLFRGDLRLSELSGLVKSTITSRLFVFLLILTSAGIVTTVLAYEPAARGASLREWRWSLLEPLVFIGILGIIARQSAVQVLLAFSLIAAGTIAATHGLLDILTEGGVLADNVRRLSGPLPHPNALALFLVRPLVLGVALIALIPRLRLSLIAPTLIIGAVLFGTFSRGAMIAMLAASGILSLNASRTLRYALGASVAGTGALAFVVAGERMRSAFEGGSVTLRLDIWTSAVRMIRDSPVFGYGPDQFLYAYTPRYILPGAWDERFTSHAHNLIADSWIRLGVIGAIAACVALIFVARNVLSTRWNVHEPQDALRIRQAALIAVAASLVHGLIDNTYFAHDLAMSIWLLAWLAFSSTDSTSEQVAYDP